MRAACTSAWDLAPQDLVSPELLISKKKKKKKKKTVHSLMKVIITPRKSRRSQNNFEIMVLIKHKKKKSSQIYYVSITVVKLAFIASKKTVMLRFEENSTPFDQIFTE
jgi:hypothetical protein